MEKPDFPAHMASHEIGRPIYMLKLLGVAALYALLAKVVLTFFSANGVVSIVWPPSGLALAMLLIGGKRYFPGVFLGAFLANAMTGLALGVAASIAIGNTLEALLGVWLLARNGRFDSNIRALSDYLRLVVLGGFVACSVAALNGATVLLLSGFLAAGAYFPNLINWWMGDALGIILITPLILAWRRIPGGWLEPKRAAEAILLLGLMFLANQIVFLGWFYDTGGIPEQVAKGYWMFLLITWVAVRLGTGGVVVALVMTAIQALLSAALGVGFFANDMAKTGLVNYWFYIVALSVVSMALATHFTERKQLEQQLSRRLRHRDTMERISQISLSSTNIEELLGKVLDEMQAIFNADRAWFLYPCDPDAPSWSVPMERTRPEWPGAFARGMVIPMTPEVAGVFREVLASTEPLPYGPAASRFIPAAVAEQFQIRSQIQMALRPKVGSPWAMGLHHCAQARAYDEDDLLIFKDIGRRVADALSSLIILRSLRESEENLNRAQAVGQIGSWLINIPANRLEWSAETYRMFGIPQQHAVDLDTFAAITHPDDRDFVFKAWGEALAGAPYDIEHRILVGGQTRWVRERAQIERDAEGRPLTGIGTVQDITERRQAEEKLCASENKFRTLFEEMVSGFSLIEMVFDKDGKPVDYITLEANREFERLLDTKRENVIGKKAYETVSGLDRKWLDIFGKVALTGVSLSYEEYASNLGKWFAGTVFSPQKGMIAGTFIDITERKKLDEELELFRLMVEKSGDPIFMIDDDDGCRMMYVNEAAIKHYGATREEILTWRIPDWDPNFSYEMLAKHVEEIKEVKNLTIESLHRVKGGSIVPVEISLNYILYKGRVCHFGYFRNITERKEHEEELKRSNIELEQFSYAVSHDMRQPLRMISSYLQLLEMGLADQLDGEKRGYFDIAIDGAKRIDQMLIELLEYSRVGRMGEPPMWIDSRALLDEALQFLQPAITEAQAKVSIFGEWPRILVSHDEILRLLQNLIGNAAKFRIAGRAPEVIVNSKVANNDWHLCVADNGVGITPSQIKRLFQIFQRLQSRDAYEGTGIGLALCRKIAEHHKGRIWAVSAGEGQGSKFCVALPVLHEKTTLQ